MTLPTLLRSLKALSRSRPGTQAAALLLGLVLGLSLVELGLRTLYLPALPREAESTGPVQETAPQTIERVPICVLLSRPGDGSGQGVAMARGLELAQEELLHSSKDRRRAIEWIVEDAGEAGQDVVDAANRTLAAGCPVVIGPVRTEEAEHALAALEGAEVALILPDPGGTWRARWPPNAVAIRPTALGMARVAARDFFGVRQLRSVAVLHGGDSFGLRMLDEVVRVGAQLEASVSSVRLDPEAPPSWRSAALAAVRDGAEALFVVGPPPPAGAVASALGEDGMESIEVWLIDWATHPSVLESAVSSGGAARTHWLGRRSPSVAFSRLYSQRFEADPPSAAATTYEAALIAAAAVDSTPFLWHTDLIDQILHADRASSAFEGGRMTEDEGLPHIDMAGYQIIDPHFVPESGRWFFPGPADPSEGSGRPEEEEGKLASEGSAEQQTAPPPALPQPGAQCPSGMVFLDTSQVQRVLGAREDSARQAEVGAFCIDRFEFPNLEGAMPRNLVSWTEADQLCTAAGKRLCSSAEWDRSCSGSDARPYSYGEAFIRNRCNTPLDSTGEGLGTPPLAPSGSHPECRSPEGVFDLNGNLSEWVSDAWDEARSGPALAAPETPPPGAGGSADHTAGHEADLRTLRGGTMWTRTSYKPSCFGEHGHPVEARGRDDGFRCCRSAE